MSKFLKNSKSQLIFSNYNYKSLKDKHFTKFLNNIIANTYNYISTKNIHEIKQFTLNNKKINHINNNIEINKEDISPEFYNIRKFKNPKTINYNGRFKAPQFRNFNKNKEKNENIIFDYKTYIKGNILFEKNQTDNESGYNPNKISNNFINLYQNEENSKLSSIKENSKKSIKDNNKKKYKINFKYNTNEGYFGRKKKMGMPFLFDTSVIFCNEYSNKSEKKRHENILNDLYKLKGFLIGDKNNMISTLKDFLVKYQIKNIEKVSDEILLSICNYICSKNKEFFIKLVKPYLTVKDLLVDLFNNIALIKNSENNDNINNNKIKMKNINYDFDINNQNNIFLKHSNSQLTNNLSDNIPFKPEKDNKKNKSENEYIFNKDKRYHIKNIVDKVHSKKDIFLKIDNSTYNTPKTYQSPFFTPFKSHIIFTPKNEKVNESKRKKYTDLYDTNSLLKNLSYQTKALGPEKKYSSNNDLIITEISKEIRELENHYNSIILTGKIFDKSKTQNNFCKSNKTNNQFNTLNNRGLSHSPSVSNNHYKLNNKDIFSNTSIKFHLNPKLKKIKNINNKMKANNLNLQIISLKNENFQKLKKCISMTEQPLFKKRIKNKGIPLNEYNIRFYYKPVNYKFGYRQVKELNKVTECAALNYAKKKKYDPLGLIFSL